MKKAERLAILKNADMLYANARARTKKNGKLFDLSLPHLRRMLMSTSTCPVLGLPLERGVGKPRVNSPSLDCFWPPFGYIDGNVNVISHIVNTLKSDHSIEDIREIIEVYKKLLAWMEKTAADLAAQGIYVPHDHPPGTKGHIG